MKEYLACKLPESELGKLDEPVRILPLGKVSSEKGDFTVDGESYRLMKEHMEHRGIDIVVDYEHQTLKDVQAPAGGWIKELLLRDDCIAARIEWTPTARKYLENKEYRYFSPVVLVRKDDGKAVQLHSLALTNTPAINGMFPIINSICPEEVPEKTEETVMDLKELLELLGLPEEADIAAVTAKVKELMETLKQKEEKPDEVVANKAILSVLKLKEDAGTADVLAAIQGMAAASTEVRALKERMEKADAEAAVARAMKDGKLCAAQKTWAEEYALKDPKGFAMFVEKAARVVPVGQMDYAEDTSGQAASEETMMALKMLGISDEDYQKYGK